MEITFKKAMEMPDEQFANYVRETSREQMLNFLLTLSSEEQRRMENRARRIHESAIEKSGGITDSVVERIFEMSEVQLMHLANKMSERQLCELYSRIQKETLPLDEKERVIIGLFAYDMPKSWEPLSEEKRLQGIKHFLEIRTRGYEMAKTGFGQEKRESQLPEEERPVVLGKNHSACNFGQER